MNKIALVISILALATAAFAQANRGPGGATAEGGAPPCEKVPNCASTAKANTFRAPQLVNVSGRGAVSPRNGVAYQAVGGEPENALFDGFAYNGHSAFVAERYNLSNDGFRAVDANQIVGVFMGAAFTGKGDPTDAGLVLATTENQTPEHNGMAAHLDFTPNGSQAMYTGLAVNPQGKGGVTVAGVPAHRGAYEGPADLGFGTLHVASSVVTGGHFESDGPKPVLSNCGGGGSIAGSDAAGQVTNSIAVTACTVTFAKPYAANVVCIVQDFGVPTPAAYLTDAGPRGFKVAWTAPYKGRWSYICQGAS